MADVKPIPEGYPALMPYLSIDGCGDAIDFYKTVFGATQRGGVMPWKDGKIGHAELEIGGSVLMLADEFPDMGMVGPRSTKGSPVTLHLYTEDVDKVYAMAIEAGAKSLQEPENQFYGDRSCRFEDPWGHIWSVSTHVEDVPPDEMAKRASEAIGNS